MYLKITITLRNMLSQKMVIIWICYNYLVKIRHYLIIKKNTNNIIQEDTLDKKESPVTNFKRNCPVKETILETLIDDLKPDNPVDDLKPDNPVDDLKQENPVDDLKQENLVDDLKPDNPVDDLKQENLVDDLKPENPVDDLKPENLVDDFKPENPVDDFKQENPVDDLKQDNPVESESQSESESESESDLTKYVFNGKDYLIDSTQKYLYDIDTQEAIAYSHKKLKFKFYKR